MRRIMQTGSVLAAFMCLSLASAQGPNPAQWVLDNMQGIWTLQSQEMNGQLVQGANPKMEFVINGNRYFTRTAGRPGSIGTIGIVDPLSNPLKIDFIEDGGTPVPSVVALQGDTMRSCGATSGVRPTEFMTRPGDGRSLSVWRRVARGR